MIDTWGVNPLTTHHGEAEASKRERSMTEYKQRVEGESIGIYKNGEGRIIQLLPRKRKKRKG